MLSSLIANDELLLYQDPCNMKHAAWRNPWDEKMVSTESFFDLFEKAQEEYSEMLNETAGFLAKERTDEERKEAIRRALRRLGNRCYHSGLKSEEYRGKKVGRRG